MILSLDWLDLAGTFKQTFGDEPVTAKVIQVSCDAYSHRGWSMDHQGLPPMDLYLMCETDAAVPLLLDAVTPRMASAALPPRVPLPPIPGEPSLRGVGAALETATRGMDVCYTRFPLGWSGAYTHFRHPLDYIGHDGGAGVGSGPGMTVGAALALKGSGRIPVGAAGRRRLPDGQHRGVDRGALPDAVPHDRVQQPLVLQRRAPPGPHGRSSAGGRRRTAGSASTSPIPTSTSRAWRA